MSGIIKDIGKVFKTTVIQPITHPFDIGKNISDAFHAIKTSVVDAWHNKIIRYAAIAVAAYFTAGAALGWFSAAGAEGAASGAVATAGTAVGGTAGATVGGSLGASLGGGAFAAQAVGTTAIASGATAAATTSAIAGVTAGSLSASAAAAIAEGSVTTLAPTVVTGVALGGGLSTGAMLAQAGGAALAGAGYAASTAPTGASQPAQLANVDWQQPSNLTPDLSNSTNVADTSTSPFGHVTNFMKNIFGSPASADGSAPAGGGLSTGKAMLISTGLQMAASMLQKQVPQMTYAGVNAKGNGPGLAIHTTPGGFGLATGGEGEPAPTGVPQALRPPGTTAGAYTPIGSSGAAPGNMGQLAANASGVGGLVPQGAINYMGV